MNIKEYRKLHNLNQSEFGRLLGVTGSYISMVESGKRKVSPEVALKIHRLSDGSVHFKELCPWFNDVIKEVL